MSIKNVFILLVVVCIVASSNAQFPPLPFPFPFQPIPGTPGEITKCFWSTLKDIPGCVAEIRQSMMTGKLGHIGPACCKALQDAEANCAHNLPIVPPMIKQQCSPTAVSPTML